MMSGPRGWMPPFTYIAEVTLDGTTTSVQGGSIPLGPDAVVGVSFDNEWNQSGTATLAATILIEGSNDPRASPEHPDFADVNWRDVTSDFAPTNPTTGDGESLENISNIRYEYIRMKVTRGSGSGPFKSFFSAHGDG